VTTLFPPEFDAPPLPDDPERDRVVGWLRRRTTEPAALFGRVLRRSLDEVLDGPRTGRWDFAQLEKTEKTYVGTKVEIVLRTALGLERGAHMDLDVDGMPVDIKWAMNSGWQIPREAVGHLCLCIGGLAGMTRFQVGVVRCLPEYLNAGENRDGKKTLSSAGRAAMAMVVRSAAIPSNFVAEMDPAIRSHVMSQRSGQDRVRALFQALPYVAIPRDAISTVARTPGDPIRRTRADKWRSDPLGGLRALNGKSQGKIIAALGLPKIAANEWIAVPQLDIDSLPFEVRF
jgi:hypothetical protein